MPIIWLKVILELIFSYGCLIFAGNYIKSYSSTIQSIEEEMLPSDSVSAQSLEPNLTEISTAGYQI